MKYRHLIILSIASFSWAILAVECNPAGVCPDYHAYRFSGIRIEPDAATFTGIDWTFQLFLDLTRTDSVTGVGNTEGNGLLFSSLYATMPCDEPPYAIPLSNRMMISRQPLLKGTDTIPPGTELLSGGKYFSSHYISHTRKESPEAHYITDTVQFHLEPVSGVHLLPGATTFVFSVPNTEGDTLTAEFEVKVL